MRNRGQAVCHFTQRLAVVGNDDIRLFGSEMFDRAAHQRHFAFESGERLRRRIGFVHRRAVLGVGLFHVVLLPAHAKITGVFERHRSGEVAGKAAACLHVDAKLSTTRAQ